ncbi:MAG: hypothetical protein RL589_44 [Actinomycetota bacterium]|jgi:dTDP-glucose 4,6-dehydratase
MILVTGAGGFIGSHVVDELLANGERVRALVHYNALDSNGWLDDIAQRDNPNLEIAHGDITDFDNLERHSKDVTRTVNLAALIPIPYSYVAPRSYVNVNINGLLNLLEIQRRTGGVLIQISTSEVFGTAQTVPISELHPRNAQSPYAATKIAADELLKSYVASFGVDARIARPFNTFGPRQSTRAVIPTIIAQALKSDCIELGDTSTTRDFNYVLDTVQGILAVLEFGEPGEDYNIGSGIERSISEIIQGIERILDKKIRVAQNSERQRPEKSEVRQLVCDPSKLKAISNWDVKYTGPEKFESTLAVLTEWYRNNSPMRGFRI